MTAAVTARLALTLASREGVPAARPEGLGAAVAGVVPRSAAVAAPPSRAARRRRALPLGPFAAARHAAAVLAGLLAAHLLLRRCRAPLRRGHR